MAEQADTGPVTVSIARRVRPGREADYEAWVSGVTNVVAGFPGYQGASVLRPAAATDDAYVVIYRFGSYGQCQAWERSAERAEWIGRLGPLVEGDSRVKRVTGLEFWFDLPEVPAGARPSTHKMAIAVTVAAYAIVCTLNVVVGPSLVGQPPWLRSLVFVVAQVVLLTYVVMPWMTRLLRPWLFGR
jgi:uncharacterized protein